jgi:ABC-type branched-subunit amino acid transport system ATPase component
MAQAGVSRSWQEVRLFGTQTLYDNVAVASPGQMGEGPFDALFRPLQVRQEQRILREKVRETLAGLGLRERIDSSADRISLGQARRVSILRAVHGGARVLFLDEPLAGLDDVGRTAVLALLRELAREHKLTLVIVEHVFNIPRVLDLANTVWTLASGRLTVEALVAVREQVAAQTGDGLLTWLREVAGPGGRVTEEQLPGGAVLRRVVGAAGGDMVLHASDLVVHRGRRLVLGEEMGDRVQGVSLTLRQGELVVLQAPNGWGKTTLLEALAGLLPLSRGTVQLLGRPVERWPAWERRRQGLTLLQARNQTFPNLTVREALRLAGVEEVPDGVARLLERPAAQLSGGEKQKVALACALQGTPFTVAILDEPFSALDLSALRETWAALAEWLPSRSMLIALPAVPGAEQGHPSMEA